MCEIVCAANGLTSKSFKTVFVPSVGLTAYNIVTILWIVLEMCAVVLTQTVYSQRLSFQLKDTLSSISVVESCS